MMVSLCSLLLLLVATAAVACRGQEQPAGTTTTKQCFGFTSGGKSIAQTTFEYYVSGESTLALANQGDVIELGCASVICPMPPVRDCFFDSSVCSSAEWCMVDTETMWGPWAMGNGGQTPGANGRAGLQCSQAQEYGMEYWFDTVCSRNTSWGPWTSMRGRCVPYRKEEESCREELSISPYGPLYSVSADQGKLMTRPLLCRPDLICTGDAEPTPHTCVKRRPPNVCFIGPWWDSTSWCKVGAEDTVGGRYETGLPKDVLMDAAQGILLQIPQEHMVATEANFWYSAEGNRSRDLIQGIVETLWPAVYRDSTTFPLPIPDPRLTGPPYTQVWNDTASQAQSIMIQTPRVWSTVHSLIANLDDVMTQEQASASQGLALFLAQSFICPDCRGFWRAEVLNTIGVPPMTTEKEAHEKWWWLAHNMVSEHTASTRGGYPWIYPSLSDAQFKDYFGNLANNTELLNCQNPFFLSYSDAKAMWKIST